ncbi:hypothetical protein QIS74_02595 [Colletotrichum tabaci]|uniref:Uncharacterized protein n=1 Tax=Colletotrichum tabaci TaxID=1209068 RepID=A0AAV9TQD0_9PEZI
MFRRPIFNRKKASELYAAYANNLGSEIQRNPYKRQILRIGALSSELNLLKDVVELQRGCFGCFAALILPETTHPLLAKQLDRHMLFEIEEGLLSELVQAVKQEDENLDGTLELCNELKGLVGELTEIMADDQGQAVFVFTVVTITFLPLSFVASYLSMSGGTDGLGMGWGDVQARFWMVAGPLTVAVATFCYFIAGRGTIRKMLSRPTHPAVTENGDDEDSDTTGESNEGHRSGWPRWLRGRLKGGI